MFEIKFRIVDNIELLKHLSTSQFDSEKGDIEGFFSLNFNGNIEGYYHDNTLWEGETGQELITLWFDLLIDVISQLDKTGYAALKIVESFDSWLEFILEDGNLRISFAKLKTGLCNEYLIGESKYHFVYPSWENILIKFNSFVQEVKVKANDYLNVIRGVNPELLNSKVLCNLSNRISLIQ